jgi:cell division protein FtsL
MHRAIGTINWLLMLATLASAVALYAIKHDTRRLEMRVLAQERALERAQNDVTVLTAERAHLARPARLEVLARAIGMTPITAEQYLRLDVGGSGVGVTHRGNTCGKKLHPTPNPSPSRGGESRSPDRCAPIMRVDWPP